MTRLVGMGKCKNEKLGGAVKNIEINESHERYKYMFSI